MINFAQVLGRVGKIETKTLSSGQKATNMSMVTSRKFMKDGELKEKVTWHNISVYSKLSDVAEKYVSVGDLLYIQGEMEEQKYTRQDGVERSKFCIIGHELKLMPKAKEHKPEPKKEVPASLLYNEPFQDCEIPF